jgi:predicted  nucleic acid-binding Zn-ribbon protein
MDINDMNARLRTLHAQIADAQKYQGQAWLNSDMVQYYQLEREICDLQTDAKALQGQIDGLNTPDVWL